MQNRSIVFTAPRVAKLLQEEIGLPNPGYVQVKLCCSTISSGTERANFIGDPNISIYGEPQVVFPRRCGYSAAGIVTAVGAEVIDLQSGDRVAIGGSVHSQYVNLPRGNVYKLPETVSFRDAALMYISSFPLAAIRKCRLEMGESAIVMGLGVLGLAAVQLLKQSGAVPVIAVDPIPEKREKALRCGADMVLDPTDSAFASTVKSVTNGGAKVGIEVTGIGAGLDGILDCMARFGRVALLGCTRNKDFTIDYYRKVHGPGITLVGAHNNARPKEDSHDGWWTQKEDMQALIQLHAFGRFRLGDMVDEVFSPVDAPKVYARLAREKAFPVVQFDWEALE